MVVFAKIVEEDWREEGYFEEMGKERESRAHTRKGKVKSRSVSKSRESRRVGIKRGRDGNG